MLAHFVKLIMNNLPYILFGIIILLLFVLIVFIRINANLSKLARKYETLIERAGGGSLEDALLENIRETDRLKNNLQNLTARLVKLEELEKLTIKRIGIVKFDAFDDISGQLSFALAILNEEKNGVILSNICSRHDSRIYIKPITAGRSEHSLTNEEKRAILQAEVLKE